VTPASVTPPSQGIFRQYDVRGIVGQDLTAAAARAVGLSYAALLAERGVTGAVAVGRDNRPSGPMLREALVGALIESGLDVIDIGVVPTPLLYWTLHHERVVGGVQITGSHNPPEYNGFKLCLGTSSLWGGDIEHLYELALAGTTTRRPDGALGTVREVPVIDRYVNDIVERIGPLKRRLKVVFDCGNGAGSLVAGKLFGRLDIDASYLYCESDGTFPNHHPDPTVVENLQDLIGAVRARGADLGIGFDGDADRIGVVDGRGEIIWGDHVLILYAWDVLRRNGQGAPIIFDVKCSQALPQAIAIAGGVPVMWKTGHSLIKEKMKQMHGPVAGEMSGHMFFSEGFYGHDDALYGAARLIRIVADAGRSIDAMLDTVPKYVSTPEIRVDCPDARKFAIVDAAVTDFALRHEVVSVDGARVLYGDGWGLIRASNTQPILVLRFEARTAERLAEIQDDMEAWLLARGVSVP
jgi:phosphomannomutase / phosphoglucomutase